MNKKNSVFTWDGDTEPEDYDDPDNFMMSAEVHPKGIRLCSVHDEGREVSKALGDLQSCPHFEYEDEYHPDDNRVTCQHCWAFGFKSVCDIAVRKKK